MTVRGPSNGGGPARGAAPSGMQLVGAVVRALDATKDAPDHARCVLQSKTAQRGFRGECRTVHWCCPLSAVCESLLDLGLLAAPRIGRDADRESARLALFVPLAVEVICWDDLRDGGKTTDLFAHFRYAVTMAAHRVGMLLRGAPVPRFLSADPAWAEPARRAEPLRSLVTLAGVKQKVLAKNTLYDQDTVSRWMAGGRPGAEAFGQLGIYFHHVLGEASALEVSRSLRWHYALADLVDAASLRFGRDALSEAARVFTAVVNCVATREVSAPELGPFAFAIAGVRATHRVEVAGNFAEHAARHGASPAFVADVMTAARLWDGIVPPSAEGMPGELELLLERLPGRAS